MQDASMDEVWNHNVRRMRSRVPVRGNDRRLYLADIRAICGDNLFKSFPIKDSGIVRFREEICPHIVILQGKYDPVKIEEWITDNGRGWWYSTGFSGVGSYVDPDAVIHFMDAATAVHFKLRWV